MCQAEEGEGEEMLQKQRLLPSDFQRASELLAAGNSSQQKRHQNLFRILLLQTPSPLLLLNCLLLLLTLPSSSQLQLTSSSSSTSYISSSSLLPIASNATSPVPYSSSFLSSSSVLQFLSPPPSPPSSFKSKSSHRITRRNLQRYELLSSSYSLISSLTSGVGGVGGSGDHRFQGGHLLSPLSPSTVPSSSLLISPTFTTEPYGSIRLSNLYGGIIPCAVAFPTGNGVLNSKDRQPILEKIYWEVRDARSSAGDGSFSPASDIPGLRETRTDGSLAFYPFSGEGALQAAELHNAHYRCVAVTGAGRLASRSILVTLVYEKPSIVVRSYDATVSEGNDALLKCSVSSELYEVVAWHTDDGEIYLPFGASTTYIPLDTRHYVLPGGELLVAGVRAAVDGRKQYRCRVGHRLTGERLDSSNWARIKLTADKSSHISYRPRFNLNASLRQTLAIDEVAGSPHSSSSTSNPNSNHHHLASSPPPVDLYCSFDGQPPPNISWYFVGHFHTSSSSSSSSAEIVTSNRLQQTSAQPIFASSFLPFSTPSSNSHFVHSHSTSSNHHLNNRRLVTPRHLRIRSPTIADLGTYICVANNSHFEVRHETDLLLRSMFSVNLTAVAEQPTSSSAQQFLPGDSVTLSCNVTSNFEEAFQASSSSSMLNSRLQISYHWYHNLAPVLEERVTSSSSSAKGSHGYGFSGSSSGTSSTHLLSPNVLRLADLRYSDAGIYQCSVRLTSAPDYEQWLPSAAAVVSLLAVPPTLVATFAEQILLADGQLALQCAATGVPAPAIIWQRNGINLTDPEANLVTAGSTGSSGGLYRYKTGASFMRRGVKKSLKGVYGKMLGDDEDDEQGFQKDDGLFGTVSYLNITAIRTQDVGLFRCLAFNPSGSAAHQARISVVGPPYVAPISDITAVQGQPLTITCAYAGYPVEEVFFLKGKRRLPFDERHQMAGGSGRLVISSVDKAADEDDSYACVVVGEGGQRAETTFRLVVVLPPVLSPILFSDALEEGMRATVVCSVVAGDAPIALQWLKDGVPLGVPHQGRNSRDQHVQVINIKDYATTLVISNVTRRHQGTYTCLASTPYTSSNQTARMAVKAAPRWVIRPSNQFAISSISSMPVTSSSATSSASSATTLSGASSPSLPSSVSSSAFGGLFGTFQNSISTFSVRFDCLATGNPTPVIRWKFLRPKYPGSSVISTESSTSASAFSNANYDLVPILSSPQIHVLENGSLLVRSLDRAKYEGVYLCEVSNGVGKPLEARASLVIHSSPQMSLKISQPHGNGGDQGVPLQAQNLGSGGEVPAENLVQLSLRRDSAVSLSCTGGGILPLSISWYKNGREISVFEGSGGNSQSSSLSSASGSFRIFEAKQNHQQSSSSSSSTSTDRQFGERTTNLLLKHLSRSDSALYVCLARNPYGSSSRAVLLAVLEPPDAPEALKAIEVGSRTVTLSWAVLYTGNLPLLSQNIEYKRESDKTWHNALMIKSNTNTVTVHGLQSLTSYEFRVAFVNELGASEHSRSITLTTQMEAPTVMPDSLRATPLSTHSIRLTWSVRLPAPESAEIEVIDGFYIGYRAVAGNGLLDSSGSSGTTTTSSSYTYKTIANNPLQALYAGKMVLMNSVTSSSSTSSGSSWSSGVSKYAFRNSGGGPSPSFLIRLQNQSQSLEDGSSPFLPSPEFLKMGSRTESEGPLANSNSANNNIHHQYYEHIVESLVRQTQYQFVVQAFNEKGAGPTSVEVTARTFTHDPPKAPRFRLENVSTHEAVLAWDYGQQQLQNFASSSLVSSNSAGSSSSSSDSSNSRDSSGPLLVDGYVISYHVAPVRNILDSPMSGNGGFYVDSSKDGSGDVLLIPDNGSGSSGGTSSLKADDWQSVTISSPSTASFTLRNLRCGTEYIARIEAFNEMGSGPPSELLRFSTLGGVPIPPEKYTSRQFIVANITTVTVNLGHWGDGGCPIGGYSVKYRSRRAMHYHSRGSSSSGAGGGGWITLSTHLMPEVMSSSEGSPSDHSVSSSSQSSSSSSSFTIRDLQPGTWHDLVIGATNDAGRREAEFSFATLTEAGATVEPLHAFESRMAGTYGSGGSSGTTSFFSALFEDPMIFIPALCTLFVLLVVTAISAFLYVLRIRHDPLGGLNSGEEIYCSHRANSRSDDLSLNSYPTSNNNNNGGCNHNNAKSLLMGKLNGGGVNNGLYSDVKGLNTALSSNESTTNGQEPLYEQTTNFGHLHQLQQQQQQQKMAQLNYLQQQQQAAAAAAMVNRSPLHQARVNLLKQMSNENLLDGQNGGQNNSNSLVDPVTIYGFVKGPSMFEALRDSNKQQQQFKTLARGGNNQQQQTSSSSSSKQQGQHHLYQLPDQAKAEAMMTLKRGGGVQGGGQQGQQQQQKNEAELIEINGSGGGVGGNGPPGPVTKLPNSYMTTFGLIRASENCFE